MASESESGHVVCSAQRGTRLARTLFVSCGSQAQLIRTAVYGTVRTVVWEGRMSDCPPYPDQDWLPHAPNRLHGHQRLQIAAANHAGQMLVIARSGPVRLQAHPAGVAVGSQ